MTVTVCCHTDIETFLTMLILMLFVTFPNLRVFNAFLTERQERQGESEGITCSKCSQAGLGPRLLL